LLHLTKDYDKKYREKVKKGYTEVKMATAKVEEVKGEESKDEESKKSKSKLDNSL